MRVAIATQAATPQGHDEDRALGKALTARGIDAFPLVWGTPSHQDLVFIKSTWDYHERLDEFLRWTETVEGQVFNPPNVLRWNSCKSYFPKLGCPIVPTIYWKPGDAIPEVPWDKVVVKPSVSAGAVNTAKITAKQVSEWLANQTQLTLVQPFLDTIATEGEWSLLYFDGAFSHAVLKKPIAGDFRVQSQFGGSILPGTPPAEARALADRIATGNLYSRVDLVKWNGEWVLGELELIEPFLYLEYDENATGRLADAIKRRLSSAAGAARS